MYPQSLIATAIQGADGPVESRDRGSIAREGAMLILILPEVQVVENYPSRLFHCCRWNALFCSLGVCVRCVDDRGDVDQWAGGLVAGSPQSSGTFNLYGGTGVE